MADILVYATLGAIILSGLVSLRHAWADYVVVGLLFFDSVVLLLTHHVAAGIVLLLVGCTWLTLRLRRDQKAGGTTDAQ